MHVSKPEFFISIHLLIFHILFPQVSLDAIDQHAVHCHVRFDQSVSKSLLAQASFDGCSCLFTYASICLHLLRLSRILKTLHSTLVFITSRHLTCSLLHLILTSIAISLQLAWRTYFRSCIATHRLSRIACEYGQTDLTLLGTSQEAVKNGHFWSIST